MCVRCVVVCFVIGVWFGSAAIAGAAEFGDVDYSGATDAVDVQVVINAALGLEVLVQHTDLDYDEITNAVDVQLVINAVLGIVVELWSWLPKSAPASLYGVCVIPAGNVVSSTST